MLPGDHPDPSLLRGAKRWYVTSTSGDWLPAFPILRSRNLGDWRQVGSVLPRLPRWADGDFWAPELVRSGGRVLAYYAASAHGGGRCIAAASAPRVSGPYRDHGPLVCSEIGEIDPLPVTDEHGSAWLVWKRDGNSAGKPTPIVAAPLAPGGLALAGPPHELFRASEPWEQGLVEAPALLRRHGLFYLLYSARRCCGLRCNYVTGVARAPSLLGPWEKRPEPLLRAGPLFRCPGHGSVARGSGGVPVFAYHAYVRDDPANRQLLIAGLSVPAEGWPELRPFVASRNRARLQRLGFEGDRLDPGWQWPVELRPAVRVADGALRLGLGALGRQAGMARFAAQAVIRGRRRGARPGLAVMASAEDAVGAELRGRRVVAWRVDEGRRRVVGRVRVRTRRESAVRLRLSLGSNVRLAVRERGSWRRVGEARPPRWTSGPRVALTVRGRRGARAAFYSLSIHPR